MRVGIYGGAFNPVHNGHLHLARGFLNAEKLDRILFVPTARPPHKSDADFVSGRDRTAMLSLAIADEPRFEISQLEFERQGKSYTYDTLCAIHALYPADKLYLIVGADQFFAFESWYRAKDILRMAVLLAGARSDAAEYRQMVQARDTMAVFAQADVRVANLDVVAISSDEIRAKIRRGEPIDPYVPPGVREYIFRKGLYNV